MYKLENYTLQHFIDNLVKELDQENSERERDNKSQLDIPFIISTLHQSFKNSPDKYNEFVKDLIEWSDYFLIINKPQNTYNGIIDVDIMLSKECLELEYESPNYYYRLCFNYDSRHYAYCECTPDMPDYREDKHCCGHGCDATFCEFDLHKIVHITSDSWDGDEHDYWDFEDSFYETEDEIGERKLKRDREYAIRELKDKIAADQRRLEELEAELNGVN